LNYIRSNKKRKKIMTKNYDYSRYFKGGGKKKKYGGGYDTLVVITAVLTPIIVAIVLLYFKVHPVIKKGISGTKVSPGKYSPTTPPLSTVWPTMDDKGIPVFPVKIWPTDATGKITGIPSWPVDENKKYIFPDSTRNLNNDVVYLPEWWPADSDGNPILPESDDVVDLMQLGLITLSISLVVWAILLVLKFLGCV
jgi:hypothetical protein